MRIAEIIGIVSIIVAVLGIIVAYILHKCSEAKAVEQQKSKVITVLTKL